MIFKCRFFAFLFFIGSCNSINLSALTNFLAKYVGDDNKEECTSADSKKEPCDENRLMLHLAKLYVISPERVILLVTADSISDVCRDVSRTINKINKDFQSCTPLSSENLYMKLFESLKAFNSDICQADARSKKVCKYSECLKELHEEYLDCEGPADWFEKTNKTIVCQIFVDILNCNYVKTGELCGMDPAYTMRSISLDVFKTVLPKSCSVPRQLPVIKTPMPPLPEQKNGGNMYRSLLSRTVIYIFFCNFLVLLKIRVL